MQRTFYRGIGNRKLFSHKLLDGGLACDWDDLWITENHQLRVLETNAFSNMIINRLFLSHNSIEHIYEAAFTNVTINELDLSYNCLGQFPLEDIAFVNVTIGSLTLSHNSHVQFRTGTVFQNATINQLILRYWFGNQACFETHFTSFLLKWHQSNFRIRYEIFKSRLKILSFGGFRSCLKMVGLMLLFLSRKRFGSRFRVSSLI